MNESTNSAVEEKDNSFVSNVSNQQSFSEDNPQNNPNISNKFQKKQTSLLKTNVMKLKEAKKQSLIDSFSPGQYKNKAYSRRNNP